MLKYIKIIIAGIAVGIANIIPGISGGTIAVIFGIYSDLIVAASLNIKAIKSNIKNYLCLFGGIGLGILLFAGLFKIIYEKFPIHTNFFFIGLILGSIFIIFEFVRETENKNYIKEVFKFIWLLIGLGIMLLLYFFKGTAAESGTAIESLSIMHFFFLFFAGFIGAAAMLIPGISGSFLLLVMGAYYTIIKAITNFNIPILITVGFGIIAGIVLSARLIDFLMKKFPKITYAFILGLVLGSIVHIYPQACQPFSMRIISAICICSGYALITIFGKTKE